MTHCLKNGIFVFAGLLICLNTYGQTITERLILTDAQDSLYLKADEITFDREGNYCFIVKKDEQRYFVTNTDTIGFTSFSSTFGNGGGMSDTYSYKQPDKPYYYKNTKGTKVYRTIVGKIGSYQTSNTKENIAIVTTFNDSAYYYINGKLLLQRLKDPNKSYYQSERDWVAFSENGNTIYYLQQDSLYYLYVNDKLIDTSKSIYRQLAINNNGDYIFANDKTVHSRDTIVFGSVWIIWDYKLKENGAYAYYYYQKDDYENKFKEKFYDIVINNQLYKDIEPVSNITLIDKNTYLYSFGKKGNKTINVNGKIYSYDFENIFYPTLDTKGNFAFYGIKDYYLYKVVNGKKEEKPVSKYGVRAVPVYISPNGNSIHYFATDDSIYLYQDEKLIFQPIQKNSNLLIRPYGDYLFNHYVYDKIKNGNSLFYLEYDKQGYFVFNGKFSKPMLPISNEHKIVTGDLNDNGFFAIQKIDNKKYLITINNETCQELDGVDYIIKNNFFFDEKELIFYGVKNSSFYQFKLNL